MNTIIEESKIANHDWIDHQARSLLQYITVIINLLIMRIFSNRMRLKLKTNHPNITVVLKASISACLSSETPLSPFQNKTRINLQSGSTIIVHGQMKSALLYQGVKCLSADLVLQISRR